MDNKVKNFKDFVNERGNETPFLYMTADRDNFKKLNSLIRKNNLDIDVEAHDLTFMTSDKEEFDKMKKVIDDNKIEGVVESLNEEYEGKIVIGHNKNWKQEIKIGKRNNQNFVQIPFARLIQMIQYKAEEFEIEVLETEESYTSKVDHLALETMEHHENYLGKRVKRGLFRSSNGILLNSDVNGSIGILRKVKEVSKEFLEILGNRGCVLQPIKLNC